MWRFVRPLTRAPVRPPSLAPLRARLATSQAASEKVAAASLESIARWNLRLAHDNTFLSYHRNAIIATVAGSALIAYRKGEGRPPLAAAGLLLMGGLYMYVGSALYVWQVVKLRKGLRISTPVVCWCVLNAGWPALLWTVAMQCVFDETPDWLLDGLMLVESRLPAMVHSSLFIPSNAVKPIVRLLATIQDQEETRFQHHCSIAGTHLHVRASWSQVPKQSTLMLHTARAGDTGSHWLVETGPAVAAGEPPPILLRNVRAGHYLHVRRSWQTQHKADTLVLHAEGEGDEGSLWHVERGPNGSHLLRNQRSGRYLHVRRSWREQPKGEMLDLASDASDVGSAWFAERPEGAAETVVLLRSAVASDDATARSLGGYGERTLDARALGRRVYDVGMGQWSSWVGERRRRGELLSERDFRQIITARIERLGALQARLEPLAGTGGSNAPVPTARLMPVLDKLHGTIEALQVALEAEVEWREHARSRLGRLLRYRSPELAHLVSELEVVKLLRRRLVAVKTDSNPILNDGLESGGAAALSRSLSEPMLPASVPTDVVVRQQGKAKRTTRTEQEGAA